MDTSRTFIHEKVVLVGRHGEKKATGVARKMARLSVASSRKTFDYFEEMIEKGHPSRIEKGHPSRTPVTEQFFTRM